jgi:hypothetical protein
VILKKPPDFPRLREKLDPGRLDLMGLGAFRQRSALDRMLGMQRLLGQHGRQPVRF